MKAAASALILASCAAAASAQFLSGTGATPANVAERLPGDDPPPPSSVQFQKQPLPGKAGNAPDPFDGTPGPSVADALDATRAALAACERLHVRTGVSVVDTGGFIRAGLAQEGARPGRIYFATRKALVALAFGLPTSAVQARLRHKPAERIRLRPNMVAVPGAVPLRIRGRLLGAIGVSGASAQQDEACASAGERAVADRLS